jgi:hypothetical protein
VPVDISEAWKNPQLADYYFGHNPANRFELTKGRDLIVDPAPASGPINFLVYPLLEMDGNVVKIDSSFSFRRTRARRKLQPPKSKHQRNINHATSAKTTRHFGYCRFGVSLGVGAWGLELRYSASLVGSSSTGVLSRSAKVPSGLRQ